MSMEKKGGGFMGFGFDKVLKDAADRKANPDSIKIEKPKQFVIPLEELQQMRVINEKLAELAQESDPNALEKIESYLRGLDCWEYIFTTGVGDERNDERDSLYFVTPSGLSLRLKRSELTRGGIKKVVKPFMELVYFQDEQFRFVSFEPQIGATTMELLTKKVSDYQNGVIEINDNLVSEIVHGEKEGTEEMVVIDPSNFKKHNGSPVNYIEKAPAPEIDD